MSISNRLERHFAVCAAAVATVAVVGTANAAIQSWVYILPIPANIDGMYINVETHAYGSAASGVAGWDINPYSGTGLAWYNAAGTGMMRYPGVTTGSAGSLDPGTFISSTASITGSGAVVFGSAAGNWKLNTVNYFGFQFRTAADGTTGVHYGYGAMQVGATALQRTLLFISYEDVAGQGIMIVPAPGVIALIGLAGLVSRRRRS